MQAIERHHHIRAATRADLSALGQVWLEMMQVHEERDRHFQLANDGLLRWTRMAEEMMTRDDAFLNTAELEGRPVGLVLGWVAHNPPIYKTSSVGFISEIAVASWCRRRGIGRALLESAKRWFGDQGLLEFQLSTAVWNENARRFWESVGGRPLLVRYRFDV